MRIVNFISLLSVVSASFTTGFASEIILRGIAVIGDSAIAHVTAGGVGTWCKAGDRFAGWTIVEIDRATSAVVVEAKNGMRKSVGIAGATIHDSGPLHVPKQLVRPEALDWNWIRSDQNPMRRKPHSLPEWAVLAWKDLDEDIRIDFRNYYRAHGWELTRVEVIGNRLRETIAPLQDPREPIPSPEEIRARARPAGKPLPLHSVQPRN